MRYDRAKKASRRTGLPLGGTRVINFAKAHQQPGCAARRDCRVTPGACASQAKGAAEVGSEMTYDYPGNELHGFGNVVPPSPAGNQFGQSAGSQGFANASVSSLPEEIEINTHGLINETVERLSFIHGVLGVLIIDREGLIVHATMPMEEAAQLTGPVLQMLSRARECAKLGLGPGDDGEPLSMLTVRTRKHEMLLCSEQSGAFAICVL